jgi:hypothetical protein
VPGNPEVIKKLDSDSPTKDNPVKPETTSESGSDKGAKSPEGERLFAGKYKTAEELEKGYSESVAERAREKAAWEAKTQELEARIESGKPPRDDKGRFAPPTGAEAKPSSFLEQPEVKAALETLRDAGGDDTADAITKLLQAQEKHLTAGNEDTRAKLEEITFSRLNDEFYAEFPDAKDLREDMDKLGKAIDENNANPKFFMNLLRLAAKGQKTEDIVKQAVKETEERVRKDFEQRDRDLKLAGGVVVGSPGSSGAIDTPDQRKSLFAIPRR